MAPPETTMAAPTVAAPTVAAPTVAAPTAAPAGPTSQPAVADAPGTPPVESPEPAATRGADSQRADVTATAAPPTAAPAPRTPALELLVEASRPLYLTHAGDGSGRLFVVEKRGTIRIAQNGALLDGFYLDLRDRVNSDSSERGLLGLAFPPNYAETGFFFVNYTNASGNTVISRFSVSDDPDLADPTSEFEILELDQPAPNHNGGNLVFGPDGNLWIGTGDGGAANDRFGNGQNPSTLLGKMLRVDVTTDPGQPYLVPANNPWTQSDWNGQDVRDEVWAIGLRNPWRYSFDRETGDLWIADVGQNQYEEVNLVPAGKTGGLNFGWPIMEGTRCFPESVQCERSGLEIPVLDYSHAEGHCSVTGGYVYRGASLPELVGQYIYGDYCSGVIWSLSWEGGEWVNRQLFDTAAAISSFGEDETGELYVLDLSGGGVYLLTAR
jgi:glucose/arabinose dehydrogenase